ncbi:MAG: T9SS type A sorting domain-containing protein [Bacteroidota bacterium]
MKRSNSTSFFLRGWATLSLVLFLFASSTSVHAQGGAFCTIACNDNIQVSLGTDCRAKITYDMVLEDADNSRICSPNGPQAFVIQILDHADKVVAETGSSKDFVTCEDVIANGGETFRVKAKHWATGNNCWGTITVEDKIKPVLFCKDVELHCNQPFTPQFIECNIGRGFGIPKVTDNCDELRTPVFYKNENGLTCGPITLSHKDEVKDIECTGSPSGVSAIIHRTWTAVDASGNSNSCVQTIVLKRIMLSDIDLSKSLPNYTDLPGDKPAILAKKANGCNPNTDPGLVIGGKCPDGEGNLIGETTRPGNGGMSNEPTGFPMKKGVPITKYKADGTGLNIGYQYPWDSYGFCEINVEYKDHIVPVCVGSYKILRTWKLIDWCTNEIVEYTQIIKVVDKEATIDCPGDIALTTNTNTKACEADFDIPDGKIWEACGEVAEAHVTIVGKRLVERPYASKAEEEFKVLHARPGRIVGSATGDPVTIDFGSVKLGGPRCDQEFATYTVTYYYIDHCGNEATCSYNVTVADKTAPTPVCQSVTTVTVDRECEAHVFAESFDSGSYDNCDPGPLTFLVRRMDVGGAYKPHVVFDEEDVWNSAEGIPTMVQLQVTDCHGNSNVCMIEVFVDDKEPPVVVVQDKTICCDLLDNNGVIPEDLIPAPVITDNCPGFTFTRTVVDHRNECYLGTVTYTYIATDRHGNVSAPVDQVITVEDCTPLDVIFPDDFNAVCTAEDGTGFTGALDPDVTGRPIVTGDDCELVAISFEDLRLVISDDACFKIARTWTVIDWCAYDPLKPSEDQFFQYVQFIKVLDQVAPILEVPADEKVCIDGTDLCETTVNVGAPTVMDCSSDVRIRAEWSYVADAHYCGTSETGVVGDASNGFVTPSFKPGVLTVTFIADDGCNNVTKKDVVYTIVDCKLPTPYCRDGIRIENMPSTGMVEIWAVDLDLGSFDNCDGCADDDVRLSFSSDVNDDVRVFTCATLGTQQVELWVTDRAGNQDFCRTFVMVQDNQNGCSGAAAPGGMAAVTGKVANTNGELIESVTVSVNGSAVAMPAPEVTGAAGNYGFDLSVGGDYTITPEKDMNPLNGVSTYDLVLLRKHVLGTEVIDNPYSLIAADINKSGTITTFDMVELRKVILQVVPTFESNESWRFVDANYNFISDNPLAENFSEVYSINNLAGNMDIDFVAVKVGDLNGTATPNSLVGAESRNYTGTLTLNATDRLVQAGETVTVEFAADMANTAGYQFTMGFNGLQMVDLVEGVAKAENFNTNLAGRGMLTTSFDGTATEGNLFAVTFKATTTGQLSELIKVNSKVTEAEAYTTAGDLMKVDLNFNTGATVATDFALSQNTPNPFTGETIIQFTLPEAGMATLRVMDVQGKVVLTRNGDFAKGTHQFAINSKALGTTGVLYYQLSSAENVATKKMIVLE